MQVEQPGKPVEVDLANAIWGPPGASFNDDFMNRVQGFYAAETRSLDHDGLAGAEVVNSWVSNRTNGRIERLISPGDLAGGPDCILTSALYFKGQWAVAFDPGNTRRGAFLLPDGGSRTVDMMTQSRCYPYLETGNLQAVALDYMGTGLRMYIVMPRAGVPLDLSRWQDWLRTLQPARMTLSMPRFSVTADLELIRPLAELGVRKAFEPGANFSRMGLVGAYISTLRHSARIDVNEEGSEAAAAAAVMMGRSLPHRMVVDRAFFFAVVDRRTGVLLLLGRVTDPGPTAAPG